TAAPARKAVAVQPDQVDVAGACGDTFLKDARAFVDHRQDQAVDDLFRADFAARDAMRLGDRLNDRGHLRVVAGRAPALVVAIVAFARLLSETTGFDECIGNRSRPAGRPPHPPADVEARQIAHGAGAELRPESGERLIDLGGRCAFQQHPIYLTAAAI